MVIGILIVLVITGIVMAVVIPTLGSTTEVVLFVALAVLFLGFAISIVRRGGMWGGWRNSGRMG